MLPVTSSFAFVSPVRVPVHVPSTFGQDGAGALASSPLPLEDPPPEDPLLDDPPLEDPLLDDPPPGDPPLGGWCLSTGQPPDHGNILGAPDV